VSIEPGAPRSASETALSVARLRAIHQLRDDEPKILNDPVVVRLLGEETIRRIEEYDVARESALVRALRSHVVSRSRFAEDRLSEAVARGVSQYVMLGAGLDTFAYRQPAWTKDLRIFEVDHPASQAVKLRMLEAQGIATPPNARYVSADFEQPSSIAEALRARDFDLQSPAFVTCLGVLVYLEPPAVDGILTFVASLTPGSEFVATISAPQSELDEGGASARAKLAAAAAAVGEPWRTHLTADEFESRLRSLGFRAVFQPTVDEIADRYYQGRSDGFPAPRRASLAVALR